MSLKQAILDKLTDRRNRNEFAKEQGFKSYSDYLTNAGFGDTGIDQKDGYNVWLSQRLQTANEPATVADTANAAQERAELQARIRNDGYDANDAKLGEWSPNPLAQSPDEAFKRDYVHRSGEVISSEFTSKERITNQSQAPSKPRLSV